MGVYHIERRGVTSRCNKPKSKENLIPMDAPMTEDEEGGMYACWNGEPPAGSVPSAFWGCG